MKIAYPTAIVLFLLLNFFSSTSSLSAQVSIEQLTCGKTEFSTTRDRGSAFNRNSYRSCYTGSSSFLAGDQAFVFHKPSNSGRLCFNLFSEGSDDLDLFIFDSSFQNCFAVSKGSVRNNRTREFIFDADPPLPAGTYYAVVDGYTGGQEDEFRLTVTCGTLNCALATPIFCGDPRTVQNNFSAPNDISAYRFGSSYRGGHTGPERLYFFDMDRAGTAKINLRPRSSSDDFELILLRDCDEYTAIAESRNSPGQEEEISIDLGSGRYYILVEGYDGTTGSFDLSVEWDCPAAPNPTTLSCGEIIEGNTFGTQNRLNILDYRECLGDEVYLAYGYEYGEAFYRFDLATDQTVDIQLDILTEGLFLDAAVFRHSGGSMPEPGNCVVTSKSVDPNKEAILAHLEAGSYWLVVDGGLPGFIFGDLPPDEGIFNIQMNCYDLPAPCDLNGSFIATGNTIRGKVDGITTFTSGALAKIDCIESAYGNQVLYGRTYTYYHSKTGYVTFSLDMEESQTSAFIFSCSTADRDRSCQGRLSVSDRSKTLYLTGGRYYQVVVVSTELDGSYRLSLPYPSGPCSQDFPYSLAAGGVVDGSLSGFGNNFDASQSGFFQHCSESNSIYSGEDRIFQLEWEPSNDFDWIFKDDEPLDITDNQHSAGELNLSANSAMGIFLFNYQCGEKRCLASAEIPPGGGSAIIPLGEFLDREGIFYLVIDKADPFGDDSFSLSWDFHWYYYELCINEDPQTHTVRFKDGLLSRLNFLDPGDEMYIDYQEREYEGQVDYEVFDVLEVSERAIFSGDIAPVELKSQPPSSDEGVMEEGSLIPQKCGFDPGETFEIKVKKADGLVLLLEPEFELGGIGAANPPEKFQKGKNSVVSNLKVADLQDLVKVDFKPDFANLKLIPAEGLFFEGHVDANRPWAIKKPISANWIHVVDPVSTSAAVRSGDGQRKILIRVDPFSDPGIRVGYFDIVTEGGRSHRVEIRQLGRQYTPIQGAVTPQPAIPEIEHNFSVFPNPSSGVIQLKWPVPLADSAQMSILNLLGETKQSFVLSAGTIRYEMNLEDLPAGAYFLVLHDDQQKEVRKIVIE